MKQFLFSFGEVIEVVVISLFTVYVVRTFLIQPFLVSGASMEPNFSSGNYLIIDELSYRFRDPLRGEVVVFRYPGDRQTFFIKRIIGLPYERIAIKGGVVRVYNEAYPDGLTLGEQYIAAGLRTSGDVDAVLGAQEYFVLGDNRMNSFDSRNWGSVSRGDITGIARLRLFPVFDARAFAAADYKNLYAQ